LIAPTKPWPISSLKPSPATIGNSGGGSSNVRQMKRKPSKLDLCIKRRGLLAGQFALRKGIRNKVKKREIKNVDLLGLEEWH